MLTRPNRQSLTAFWGRIAALEWGGGKLFVRSSHCLSDKISILRSVPLTGVRAAVPQSMTPGVEEGELFSVNGDGDEDGDSCREAKSGIWCDVRRSGRG